MLQTARSPAVRQLILIWLAWFIILFVYQAFVTSRLALSRPDFALQWTRAETDYGSQRNKPYLNEPFMNAQVSWDSEHYLSIAIGGYDDPAARRIVSPEGGPPVPPLQLNYAFFPLYPLLMRVVAAPLSLFGLTPTAAATLAGVIVSLAGTLAAMLALYDLVRERLSESGGQRAAFYLLVFPSGFFLAQVYSEGLFVGLAFGALALMKRERLLIAGALAALAVWTRAVGVALVLPLALAWLMRVRSRGLTSRSAVAGLAAALLPLAAYGLWNAALGEPFHIVEAYYFRRGALLVEWSLKAWQTTFALIGGANPQASAYYALEFGGMALALAACLLMLPRYPGPALFGLGALVIAFTSGVPQSMIRYVLVAPPLYILPAWLGRWPAFDRAWTTASLLLMGLLAALFSFDMWVG